MTDPAKSQSRFSLNGTTPVRKIGLGFSSSPKSAPAMSREKRQRLERAQVTVENKIKSSELDKHGVDCHDFQTDADLQRSKALTKQAIADMRVKQRDIAESYREAVVKRQEEADLEWAASRRA